MRRARTAGSGLQLGVLDGVSQRGPLTELRKRAPTQCAALSKPLPRETNPGLCEQDRECITVNLDLPANGPYELRGHDAIPPIASRWSRAEHIVHEPPALLLAESRIPQYTRLDQHLMCRTEDALKMRGIALGHRELLRHPLKHAA